jgi:hypothetical protein
VIAGESPQPHRRSVLGYGIEDQKEPGNHGDQQEQRRRLAEGQHIV